MPLYEYECAKCGETIEVIQKFSDVPLKKHKGCGGALTKLISASGFQFKGTGWYVTDYAKDKKSDSKETSSNGNTEGSSDKPDAKADKGDKGDKGDKAGKAGKADKADSSPKKSGSSKE